MFESVDQVMDSLLSSGYLTQRRVAATVFLAGRMNKPLLVEGPAGVGKTELALAMARALDTELIRLQCYPGLDESKALYEWNYQKQLLFTQSAQQDWQNIKSGVYKPEFLLERPVLKAFTSRQPVVLLIDEVDKSDEELESFLLEALSDFQVSIPEYGTIKAIHIPHIVITSNNTRDLSDALKRRCLHLYIHFPTPEQEEALIQINLSEINRDLCRQVALFVSSVRKMPLKKLPGIAETIDWARALTIMNASWLGKEAVEETLNSLLKYEDDVLKVSEKIDGLLPGEIPPGKTGHTAVSTTAIKGNPAETAVAANLSRFDF